MKRIPIWIRYLLKPAIGLGIIWLLVAQDVLNPGLVMEALRSNPMWILFALGIYILITFSCGIRWLILLRSVGVDLRTGHVLSLHMIGIFFNSLLPGGTGGDLVKGYYLFRESGPEKRSLTLTSLVMDRLLGLYGLLCIGVVMMSVNQHLVVMHPLLQANAWIYGLVFTGFTIMLALFLLPASRRILKGAGAGIADKPGRFPGARILISFWSALQSYRKVPLALGACVLLTLLNHVGIISLYVLSSQALGIDLPFLTHGFVAPTLTLVNGLPIAPAGIGVGEAAGKFLYSLVGLRNGGGEVLALVHICVIVTSLCGAPFYFLYKVRTKAWSRPL